MTNFVLLNTPIFGQTSAPYKQEYLTALKDDYVMVKLFGTNRQVVELSILAQKHWVTSSPVLNASIRSCKSQRFSEPLR